ncbi:hypothetical protein OS128_05265 [Corynebacterium sp. P5848]|uniref:hypothetical protein n=1 Tax=Corynebacterium marambiense TaxID=2765364 RepID=UPI002260CD57|nr:hypothetical protein [Corynebacterium marambiense]MCX7542320.1 hypothetical protein [Corynebacterium marambiense]
MRYRYAVPDAERTQADAIVRPKKLRFGGVGIHHLNADGKLQNLAISQMEWGGTWIPEDKKRTLLEVSTVTCTLPELYRLHTEIMTARGYIVEWQIPEKEETK